MIDGCNNTKGKTKIHYKEALELFQTLEIVGYTIEPKVH
jgi:hypothetical protein